jgi:N5-(cytidine 5'-diphosphoramidyl)-L-glutamine hydrolase
VKPVAVSQRVEVLADRNERRDALDQALPRFLCAAGFLAFPTPNCLVAATNLRLWLEALAPKAVVLSGGDDIGVHDDRDSTEIALLEYASQHGLPALGICRGMQLMGKWGGVNTRPAPGHVRVRHPITGEITGSVNSYHNLALASCPADFDVIATSDDGEIEAIRHRTLRWQGWMWHPEREPTFDPRDIDGIRALFDGPERREV